MASNKSNGNAQNAKAIDQYKMEAANEVGVDLNKGGNITSREAGLVGGHMVRNMINQAKNTMAGTSK